ncbi:MAG: DUF4215 domain-containing protein [Candidatus Peribacteraceae bacterium]|nr:DUF4215 domain-containing protein [Candidatus Peribacteraceae bacterium]
MQLPFSSRILVLPLFALIAVGASVVLLAPDQKLSLQACLGDGNSCTLNGDCCTGVCAGLICGCHGAGSTCSGTQDCCSPAQYVCDALTCRGVNGAACTNDAQCSTALGLTCIANICQSGGAVCGNGAVTGAEQCDDGNTTNGDCCSSTCSYEASGASCGATKGVCDVQDTCNGSGTCTDNGYQASGTSCRAAVGVCDEAETCTGSSGSCPSDGKLSSVCRAVAGLCDSEESCDGVNDACPADAFLSAASTCRADAGQCDVAENCTGASASCPSDSFEADGTTCSSGQCAAGSCVSCVNNTPCTALNTTCATYTCDVANHVCEASYTASGTACTADAEACTQDICSGSSATCSHPAGNSGTSCRAKAGVCDVAEACNGSSTTCPTDGFASTCTQISPTEWCTGNDASTTSITCTNNCGNGVVNQGEECDDGNQNNSDSCTNVCRKAYCGDGILGPGEQCEPPNTTGCRFNCTVPSSGTTGGGVTGGTTGGPGGIPGGGVPGGFSSSSNPGGCVAVGVTTGVGNPGGHGMLSSFTTFVMDLLGFEPAPLVSWQCPKNIRCCSNDGRAYGKLSNGTEVTDGFLPPGVTGNQVQWGLTPKECAVKDAIGDKPADQAMIGICDSTVVDVPIDDDRDGVTDSTKKFVCLKTSTPRTCRTSGGQSYNY